MPSARRLLAVLILLVASFAMPAIARAETFHTCAGFIDSVPAVITTQGVWCLRKDLSTSLTSANVIDIRTSNVTIDCNGFKIGNLSAGTGTNSTAIYAYGTLSNITVRNCNIRGFHNGIAIYANDPGSGHVVEDNTLDQNTGTAIYLIGYSSLVRHNGVFNTGGRPGSDRASAISTTGDAIDNIVDGISGTADVANFSAYGIYAGGVGATAQDGVVVQGNHLRNLVSKGTGEAQGIIIASYAAWVRDNSLVEPAGPPMNGKGVYCSFGGYLTDNLIANFSTNNAYCVDKSGNILL